MHNFLNTSNQKKSVSFKTPSNVDAFATHCNKEGTFENQMVEYFQPDRVRRFTVSYLRLNILKADQQKHQNNSCDVASNPPLLKGFDDQTGILITEETAVC